MLDLSPALAADLAFTLERYGLTIEDVPRDHEGKTITDRVAMLCTEGESFCGSLFRKTDLRNPTMPLWKVFPENPATVRAQTEAIDEVSELMQQEEAFRLGTPSPVCRSDLPRREHVAALEGLLAYIDGTAGAPDIDRNAWADTVLFDEATAIVPRLREAEAASATRAQLVDELASGAVPPASAIFVARALDSTDHGLRNADITLAGARVSASNLRDATQATLERVLPHFEVAERIRQLRDDLDVIDEALHWPGAWQTVPKLRIAVEVTGVV